MNLKKRNEMMRKQEKKKNTKMSSVRCVVSIGVKVQQYIYFVL